MSEALHTVKAVQDEREWWPRMVIECPHDLDNLDRDCVTIRCWEGFHGEGCDDTGDNCNDKIPGVCVAKNWLDAAGPDGIALRLGEHKEVELPFDVRVEWNFDHPVLCVV